MIETPDYDAMRVGFDDPMPLLAELADATAQPLPVIDEAHGGVTTTVDTTPYDPQGDSDES